MTTDRIYTVMVCNVCGAQVSEEGIDPACVHEQAAQDAGMAAPYGSPATPEEAAFQPQLLQVVPKGGMQ